MLDSDRLVIVDVGAAGGLHARWARVPSPVRAVLFDADPAASMGTVRSGNTETITVNAALSDREEDIEFHLCKKRENSSRYLPNHELIDLFPDAERFQVTATEKLHAMTLSGVFSERAWRPPHFMKLDAQGSELLILKGAADLLGSVVGLEVEVLFVPLYVNQPLYFQVDEFLREKGFALSDVVHNYWKRKVPMAQYDGSLGELIFGDVLYWRTIESLCGLLKRGYVSTGNVVGCFLAYGYTHQAGLILEFAVENRLVSFAAAESLRHRIASRAAARGLSGLPKAAAVKICTMGLLERWFPNRSWSTVSKQTLGT